MAEGVIQLPPDSTGKSLRTMTGGAAQPVATHQEVHTLALPDGTLVSTAAPLPAVIAGVATQVTLAAILAALAQVPVTGPVTDTQLRAAPVPVTSGPARQKRHLEFVPSSAAPTTIYTGSAPVGTADTAAAWTIQRLTFTGATNIDETWSSTTAVWANRATEVYT